MAGSYQHVVSNSEPVGSLMTPKTCLGMLGTRSGDVYECIEEMYGMIWWLASYITSDSFGSDDITAGYVEAARENYKEGLAMSPTKRFQPKKE